MLREVIEPGPQLQEHQLREFTRRYGLKLPMTYERFLLKTNGGQPVPGGFPIEGFPENPAGVIQVFFGLNMPIRTEDLEVVMQEHADRIPKGICPIACTEGYDFVCLDLRHGTERVKFWDRRPFWGTNVWKESDLYLVTVSFTMLLSQLHDLRY